MAEDKTTPPNDEVVAVSDEALQKAESFVEAEEGAANRLMGWAGKISTTIAVVMSLFHLYAAYAIVPTQELRYTHVAFTLVLSFLLFPLATRFRNRVRWWDIVPGIVAVATIVYALWGGEDFTDRATAPDRWDVIVGIVFIVLLLEATRRTTGAIMPVVSLLLSLTPCSARICRRRGPIAATTSPAWSATSSLPWRAFSASPSTYRQR